MSISDKPLVALSVGTSSWSLTLESEAFQNGVLVIMREHGIKNLDTSRRYGGGASEDAIGNKRLGQEFIITSKAPAGGAGDGGGKRENILQAMKASLAALNMDKVPIYLLHAPDETVSVEETYSAVQTLYEEGCFEKFGLSNFSKDQVLEYYNHAKFSNLVLPTVYQSTYSPALRMNESILFPTLRSLGISIQAFSPLAAGFLSKTVAELDNATGRWDPTTISGRLNRYVFCKPSYLRMLDEWGNLAEKSGVGRVGLAYRWVRYHSALDGGRGDEMIIGASSVDQFRQTIEEIEKGPLEEWVAERVHQLWEMIAEDAEVDFLMAFKKLMQ